MSIETLKTSELITPLSRLLDIAEAVAPASWVLVGGLMVQVHAGLAGVESRVTRDVDLLIDLMASPNNARNVVQGLEGIGFSAKEPGLRGSAFHRLTMDDFVVDVLVADHLPKSRQGAAKVNRWPLLETPGGAQAIERKKPVRIVTECREATINVPDLLGALVLKSAVYMVDTRSRRRHLDDIALLASLVSDLDAETARLHGSDKKRLRAAAKALQEEEHPSWLMLSEGARRRGRVVLRVLSA